ncbi:MOSC N-terminal beta barrel domain-containing protein [Dactylosporangium sp. NPDC050688]|uniref:MOSC N-terminal beta barrel domain-containing protein n=1 Tax=Dactylosporangium sp. NPDC050688 TaxID=3157217 RepID=UPI0033C3B4F1
MRVVELWRYPMKSAGGERLDAAEVTADGLVGDRMPVGDFGWYAAVEQPGRIEAGQSGRS